MTDDPVASLPEDNNVPIVVRYGNTTLDFGMASIPKLFLRFFTYLRHGELKLLDSEAMMLVEVMGLYGKPDDGDDYELRTRNLPVATADITLDRHLTKMRKMGVVFTERLWYPPVGGRPPVTRAIRWDLRSLTYNLEQIAELWRARQGELVQTWKRGGQRGYRPVYVFPTDYAHEVLLPLDVALDIVRRNVWPANEWFQVATHMCQQLGDLGQQLPHLPTGLKQSGSLPTGPKESGRALLKESDWPPTGPKESGHLIKNLGGGGGGGAAEISASELSEEDQAALAHFLERLGQPHAFSEKELKALAGLRADGYSQAEILGGIDQAFDRPGGCRHFTFVAARLRNTPPAAKPESQTPEGRRQPAPTRKLETGSLAEESALDVPPELVEVVRIFSEHGETLTAAKLARLKRMAETYQPAAAQYGATAAIWMGQAMTQGLGEAKSSLIGFADTILRRWAQNGPDGIVEKGRPEGGSGKAQAGRSGGDRKPVTRKSTAADRIARTEEALANYRRPNGN